MDFRVVAPFCTTLTHFKPPHHPSSQPFSEKKQKKFQARGADYLIYCGSYLFFDPLSPSRSDPPFRHSDLVANRIGIAQVRGIMTILPLILTLPFAANPPRLTSAPLVA
jgi:hypothetical protein